MCIQCTELSAFKGTDIMYDGFAKEFEEDIEKKVTMDKIVKFMKDFKASFDVALENLEILQSD